LFDVLPPIRDGSGRQIIETPNVCLRQERADPVAPASKPKSSRGTILAVSNDQELVDFLRSVYKNREYRFHESNAVDDKLTEVMSEIQPNIVIVDITMPLMTGVGIALRIHIDTIMPTILLTRWETDNGSVRLLDVHSPSGLSAPITAEELVERTDSIINGQGPEALPHD
jgi:DNA-binding response OmpR family regulator